MADTTFKHRKDATKAVEQTENDFNPKWFCPLINGTCIKSCICYKPHFVDKAYTGVGDDLAWRIVDARCGNEMFSGSRKCEVL